MNRYQVIVEFEKREQQPAWFSPMYEGDMARAVYAAYANRKGRPWRRKIAKVLLCKHGVVIASA